MRRGALAGILALLLVAALAAQQRPVPSTTTASAGAASLSLPTETTLPSANRIEACCSSGPAAVRIVAFRIRTGGAGGRR